MKSIAIAAGVLSAGLLLLNGCAVSSGAVLVGPETYLLKRDGGLGVAGITKPLVSDLRDEVAAYCLRTGRTPEIIDESQSGGMPPLRSASAEMRFRCVAFRPAAG